MIWRFDFEGLVVVYDTGSVGGGGRTEGPICDNIR